MVPYQNPMFGSEWGLLTESKAGSQVSDNTRNRMEAM